MLKFNPCDFRDAYVFVSADITIIEHAVAQLAHTICAPFIRVSKKFLEK